RSKTFSPLDPPAECPATGPLGARWEPRTGVRSSGSHRRLSQSPTIPSSRFAGGTSAAASRQEMNEQMILQMEKCYPCVCLKCYPCLCPLPSSPLSLSAPEGERLAWGVFVCCRSPFD